MKKFFALVLVLALVALVTLPALADGNNETTGYIKYSVDNGKTWHKAPEYTGDYGHRIAFTCAQALFPAAPYDYVYTGADWKEIEDTWVSVQVLVPEGAISRIWAYSWKQDSQSYDGGYLMELTEGYYEFSVKNGEIQNWPIDESFAEVDLGRIFDQKHDGNVNVEHELAFTGITANLEDQIPDDLKYSEIIEGPLSSVEPD